MNKLLPNMGLLGARRNTGRGVSTAALSSRTARTFGTCLGRHTLLCFAKHGHVTHGILGNIMGFFGRSPSNLTARVVGALGRSTRGTFQTVRGRS